MRKLLIPILAVLLGLCSCKTLDIPKNTEVDVVAHVVIPTVLAEHLDFYVVYEDFSGNRDSTQVRYQEMTENEGISYKIYEEVLFAGKESGARSKVGFIAKRRGNEEWPYDNLDGRVIVGAAAVDFYNGVILDYLTQSYTNFDDNTLKPCDPDFIISEIEAYWRGAGKACCFGTKTDETYGLMATSEGMVDVSADFWPEGL